MRNAALSDSYFTPLELASFYTVAVKMLKSGLIISIITYFYGCLWACLFCLSLFYILRLCKSIEPALISLYFTSKESDFLEQYVSEGLFFFAAFSLISWISAQSLYWTILESKISLCSISFWHTHFTGPSVDPSTVHWSFNRSGRPWRYSQLHWTENQWQQVGWRDWYKFENFVSKCCKCLGSVYSCL